MPELPEVELVVRSLNKLVRGKRIVDAQLFREKLIPSESAASFRRKLAGETIRSVGRRGKHILIDLGKQTLIVHLRMSGRFMLLGSDDEDPKFAHAVLFFDDTFRLVFQDQRHFGFMRFFSSPDIMSAPEIAKLAPEPFSSDFSFEYVRETLSGTRRTLKQLLLDQTKFTGLGNIYAAEAMFLARLNPELPANEVSAVKAKRLQRFIIEVLQESIDYSSTLNVDPANIEDSYYGGAYESHWRVYDRENEPCQRCGTKIKRIKQGGRSTYYCPRCQRR